jgi:hypothetical protein
VEQVARVGVPPFWQPLSNEERFLEWTITDGFCSLIGPRQVDRAVRNFKRAQPPDPVARAFLRDPLVLRTIIYTFHPRRGDVDAVPTFRQYVNGIAEPRYLLGIGPSFVKARVPLAWVTNLVGWFKTVWRAQDLKANADPRDFDAIVEELTDESRPVTTIGPDGTRTVVRSHTADGCVFTFTFLDRPNDTPHEEYVWDFRGPVDPADWRERIDHMLVQYVQQWSDLARIRDSYFCKDTATRRRARLMLRGRVIAERPMHLKENHRSRMCHAARRYAFEPDESGRNAAVSAEETAIGFYETVLAYDQRFGVPGVLRAPTHAARTKRSRTRGISCKLNGKPQLTATIDYFDGRVGESPAGDRRDGGGVTENAIRVRLDGEGRLHRPAHGVQPWTDPAIARTVLREQLVRLRGSNRRLALLLMEGLTPTDAARELRVTAARVSQKLARVRDRLAPALAPRTL